MTCDRLRLATMLLALTCGPTAAFAQDTARDRCTDFYANTKAGTVAVSGSPIENWRLLDASGRSIRLGSPDQTCHFVYNHKYTGKTQPTYFASMMISYYDEPDGIKNLFVYRNRKWTRSDVRYKTPRYLRALRDTLQAVYDGPDTCANFLNLYKNPTFQDIDAFLSGSRDAPTLLDGSPYDSDDETFDAAGLLQSRARSELQRCRESSQSCKCKLHYFRFTPMQGRSCSSSPVDWNSWTPGAEKVVILPFSPNTPDMIDRIEITFDENAGPPPAD